KDGALVERSFMATDVETVRAANEAYYAALSARDLMTMEQLWSRSPDDVNVAPPIRPVAHRGWAAVRDNYEQYWSSLDALTVSMAQPAIKVEGDVAWVFGTAQAARRFKDGQANSGPTFDTSIFVKRDGRWLMIFHQTALMSR